MAMSFGSFATRVVATKVVATDGTGDFTDVQSAINDLPAGGGVVYIKEGTYDITSAITINVDNTALIGAGRSTIINGPAAGAVFDMLSASGLTGLVIQNIRFVGNGKNNSCIYFSGVTDSYISNCWIEGMEEYGIEFDSNSDRNVVYACDIKTCTLDGIHSETCYYNTISNCTFHDNGHHGIHIKTAGGFNVFIGNHVHNNGWEGISAAWNADCIFISNTVRANVFHGIDINLSARTVVANNQVQDNDVNDTATYDGIRITNSDFCIVEGNMCSGNDNYQINIAGVTSEDNLIHGNMVLTAGAVGGINDDGIRTTIVDNVVV